MFYSIYWRLYGITLFSNTLAVTEIKIKNMKFKSDTTSNSEFEKIESIRFFPYVGKKFKSEQKRIMIFAHNMYCPIEKYESEQIRTSSKTHFADALEEYTYQQGWWTTTFRNFVKGSLAIRENYNSNSSLEIIEKVDKFIETISYINYVNDFVPTNIAINVKIENQLIEKSHIINKEILRILDNTHIVCWGKNVFNYLLSQPEVKVLEKWKDFNRIDSLQNRKGFEYAKIELNGKIIHSLKVFHPSMPSFGHYNENTQNILDWFYKL